MIEFTNLAGERVAVNPMLVFAVEQRDDGALIVSAAGGVVFVRESFDEVQRRMKAWTKST